MTDTNTPTIASAYAETLNALCDMQASPAYAVRKAVLVAAENAITALERDLAALRAELERMHAARDKAIIDGRRTSLALDQRAAAAEADAKRYKRRWQEVHGDPSVFRHLLYLLHLKKGSDDDFDKMVDRIAASYDAAALKGEPR